MPPFTLTGKLACMPMTELFSKTGVNKLICCVVGSTYPSAKDTSMAPSAVNGVLATEKPVGIVKPMLEIVPAVTLPGFHFRVVESNTRAWPLAGDPRDTSCKSERLSVFPSRAATRAFRFHPRAAERIHPFLVES